MSDSLGSLAPTGLLSVREQNVFGMLGITVKSVFLSRPWVESVVPDPAEGCIGATSLEYIPSERPFFLGSG